MIVVVDVRVVVVVGLPGIVETPEVTVCLMVELCLIVPTTVDEGWKLDWDVLLWTTVIVEVAVTGVAC